MTVTKYDQYINSRRDEITTTWYITGFYCRYSASWPHDLIHDAVSQLRKTETMELKISDRYQFIVDPHPISSFFCATLQSRWIISPPDARNCTIRRSAPLCTVCSRYTYLLSQGSTVAQSSWSTRVLRLITLFQPSNIRLVLPLWHPLNLSMFHKSWLTIL